jgi:hypothetical protein
MRYPAPTLNEWPQWRHLGDRCEGPRWLCETCHEEMEDPAVCWACGDFLCSDCMVENAIGEWVCPECAGKERAADPNPSCTCELHSTLREMVR